MAGNLAYGRPTLGIGNRCKSTKRKHLKVSKSKQAD